MQLSKEYIKNNKGNAAAELPDETLLTYPEKIVQFGTGVLLRALPDYFVDKANKQGLFKGRVVIVKSTNSDSSAFDQQDGLYTVCVRGIENGKTIEENIVNASVSRVLSATTEWQEILQCAHNPAINIIFSNTTEVGIQLTQDHISSSPPHSFPGKLLAYLAERYKALKGTPESGMVIVPTELITDNGTRLASIVLELAEQNKLEPAFITWLREHNSFCNSLVDRIVPGKPDSAALKTLESKLGYEDNLLTMSEVFRLWAIEGDEKVREVLSFYKGDHAVVITPDITLFKELKLRLLNGTHTFNCGLAYLAGFSLTREAVLDPVFSVFAKKLMQEEIARAIPYAIDPEKKRVFAQDVFERFCNPFIDHQWLSITVQYSSKMKMRNMPLIKRHYELNNTPPVYMATGFAAFLLFMKANKKEGSRYYGEKNGEFYEIKDEAADYFYHAWQKNNPEKLVQEVLENKELWGANLAALPGFLQTVTEKLTTMMSVGVLETIAQLTAQKVSA